MPPGLDGDERIVRPLSQIDVGVLDAGYAHCRHIQSRGVAGDKSMVPFLHRMSPAGELPIEGELPSLGSASGWLNSQRLTAANLRGKVVLIEFLRVRRPGGQDVLMLPTLDNSACDGINSRRYDAVNISIPAAVSVFPGENYQAPRSWAERAYHKLIYYDKVDKGGHYAAWEQPRLFSKEVRAGFRLLR
jgi:hypothetical protein